MKILDEPERYRFWLATFQNELLTVVNLVMVPLVADKLPDTAKIPVTLLKVSPEFPPIDPESLKRTCVFEPGETADAKRFPTVILLVVGPVRSTTGMISVDAAADVDGKLVILMFVMFNQPNCSVIN